MNNFFSSINLKNLFLDTWHIQLHNIRLPLFISFTIGFGGIIAVYILSLLLDVPPSWFTRDPNDITGAHAYIGLLSNLGIMGWTAAASICFWASSLLRNDKSFRKSTFFLFISALFCLLLTFDDAFMLHERVFPKLHIPEEGVFIGYLLMISGYLGYFFRRILETEYIILILAIFFLGLSAGMDQIFSFSEFEAFLEDCPKFVGIVLWLTYYSRTSLIIVKNSYSGRGKVE